MSISLYPVQIDGKCGYIYKDGTLAIKPQFDIAGDFDDGLAPVQNWTGDADKFGRPAAKHGFINSEGDFVVPAIYDAARHFTEGLAAVLQNGEWGYIDRSGHTVVEPQFFTAYEFSEGLGPVDLDRKRKAMIDASGRIAFQMQASCLGYCMDGLIPCEQGRSWSYLRRDGSKAYDLVCTAASAFSEQRAAVLKEGLNGYIDTSGDWAIPPQFAQAGGFSEGVAVVEVVDSPRSKRDYTEPQQFAFIDRAGHRALDRTFRYAQTFSEGLAAVKLDDRDRYAYIDFSGEIVIPPLRCSYAEPFRGDLARLQSKTGNWWYINRSGEFMWKN